MPKLGAPELAIILLIILMVFGVGKLPQVGASLGKAIRGFKEGANGTDEEKEEVEVTKKPRRRTVARRTAKKSAETKEPDKVATA